MLKKENSGDGGGNNGGNNNWARACDTCLAAACTVYCRADSAYLCANCDSRIHTANRVASRHERLWVCEACECAPATFLCKADAASLCTACDSSIHSANPLARRHQRVPILPISGSLYGNEEFSVGEEEEEEEDEAASWLLLNPGKKNTTTTTNNNKNNNDNNGGFLFGGEVDDYLDLVEYSSKSCVENQYADDNQHYKNSYGDESVVPVQAEEEADHNQMHHQYRDFQLGFDFESSKPAYTYDHSINHGVPISGMEMGMVGDQTMRMVPDTPMDEVSTSHQRPPKGTIDLFSSLPVQMSSLLSPGDREARVLRYREKKKTRKFEKKIRYASRKAYAETRPRIKGRFAKRTDGDQMFSTSLMAEMDMALYHNFN